jgi:hypothetical protein
VSVWAETQPKEVEGLRVYFQKSHPLLKWLLFALLPCPSSLYLFPFSSSLPSLSSLSSLPAREKLFWHRLEKKRIETGWKYIGMDETLHFTLNICMNYLEGGLEW